MHLFSRRTSLRSHKSGDASAPGVSETSAETVLSLQRVLFIYLQKGVGARIACIISYQIATETMSMQCRDQLSHEVTKRVIKAAIKLCMHVICYIWVTLRICPWNGFQNCPGARDVTLWKFLITIIVTKIIPVISIITVLFKCAGDVQKVQTQINSPSFICKNNQIKWLFVCIITKTITLPMIFWF